MKKVAVFQHCDQHGNNRLVDRVCTTHQQGYDWVKKTYMWAKDWFFAHNPDGSYPLGFEPQEFGMGMFFMIGTDPHGSKTVVMIEERNLY